jgi:hypothetical protein
MLSSGAARQQFTDILNHDSFGCSCELELIVEPARVHGRQASGPGKKTWKRPPAGKLGQSKTWAELETQPGNFPRLKLVHLLVTNLNHHDCRSCEFLVLLLFSLFNYNKAIFHFSIRSIKLEDLL